ncbi:iron-containing alcohol dehydrogenase [Anaeromicrobium sediminis]|uniref:NADH-dependent alcohol dehydrogenase n=1 Tax=Anaeromicrobium sediminis TaxID=1478221 RepID=A0A267MMB9_9FIRM|nr:iron-containing alcohol dehydrogenase [Anaeromicrobium sediminis]PAB60686.1 NADH-dependent alcohol dehydrogenase [Anaeromicrobium sediminis]
MLNFDFQNKTKIIFGKDTENRVGQELKIYGKKVLLHFGGGSIKKYGLYDKVLHSLQEAGIVVVELGGVEPNPKLSLVNKGIEICKSENIDSILAVGGGSVIDSAKAIGVGAKYDGDVWDFCLGKAEVKDTLPVGVILTIPAAGSESSSGSVITKEEGLYKKAFGSPLIRPKFAILNPEITFTLPKYQTAAGIVDMMAHIMERYFTNEQNVDLTDRLCEGTLKAIIDNASTVLETPDDYDARAEIMWASTIAHNDLLSTGRMGDWASHNIEHELSGIYDMTHGAGLAIIFPAWMKYVYKHDLSRFIQFATRVWDVPMSFDDPQWTALEGINRMESFFKSLGMPTTLKDAGITEDRYEEMAKKATEFGPQGNFIKLEKDDIVNIYKLAK